MNLRLDDEYSDSLSLLVKAFQNVGSEMLDENKKIEDKYNKKKNINNKEKDYIEQRFNDYEKNINEYNLKIKEICDEFQINLKVNNELSFNYKIDEECLEKKISDSMNKIKNLFVYLKEEISQLKHLTYKKAIEERKKLEEEELKRKKKLEEEELQRRKKLEQEILEKEKAEYKEKQRKAMEDLMRKKHMEEQQKKKENEIYIGSIISGGLITLILGLYCINKYDLQICSIGGLIYFIFSLLLGTGGAIWIYWVYKDKLFSCTELGYKRALYIHAIGIPISQIIILYLAIKNKPYIMIFFEIIIIACLFRYWYEDIGEFTFMKKLTYKRIFICSGIILLFSIFGEFLMDLIIGIVAIIIVLRIIFFK